MKLFMEEASFCDAPQAIRKENLQFLLIPF